MTGKHRLRKEESLVPLGAVALGGILSFVLGAFIVSAPQSVEPTPITTLAAPTSPLSTLVVPSPTVAPSTATAPTEDETPTYEAPTYAPTTTRIEPEAPIVEEAETTPQVAADVPDLVTAARAYLDDGIPYLYGGKDESGMDCSAFIWHALLDVGYDEPYRTSTALREWTTPISADEARAGDLVFWPGHVGLYSGDGNIIDMSSGPGTVAERAAWGTPTYGRLP